MSVSFRIFPERGLVYVRYEGFARLDDSFRAFADYARHPDFQPGQKQLVDMTALTGIETDFARLLDLQAHKAATFMTGGAQTLIAYLAPTRLSFDVGSLIQRSWEVTDSVVAMVMQDEAHALEALGQPESRLEDLLARAG